MRNIRAAFSTSLLIPLLLLAACESPLDPFQPEIDAAQDNFQLQATGVIDVTTTRTWVWTNTGTRASIDHSTTKTAGTAQLVIRDATGTIVYDHGLQPSLNEPTAPGTAGVWSVQLRLDHYSGTLNFRAQKL